MSAGTPDQPRGLTDIGSRTSGLTAWSASGGLETGPGRDPDGHEASPLLCRFSHTTLYRKHRGLTRIGGCP